MQIRRHPRSTSNPRGRPSEPLYRNSEHISHAALGLDDARRAGVAFELAPEAKNLHIDAAIEDILVNACSLQEVLATERALRGIEKGEQQRVLTFSQGDRSAARIGELPSSCGRAASRKIESGRARAPARPVRYRTVATRRGRAQAIREG